MNDQNLHASVAGFLNRATVGHHTAPVQMAYQTPAIAAEWLLRHLEGDGYLVLHVASLSDADLHTLLDMRRRGDAS